MSKAAMFACVDPVDRYWRSGPQRPSGKIVSIGWKMPLDPIDGGIPVQIAEVLATAMTELGRIVFPSSDLCTDAPSHWVPCEGDYARAIAPGGLIGAMGRMAGARKTILIATRERSTALKLFDDGGFNWSMGTQVALLADADRDLPSLDWQHIEPLLEADWNGVLPALAGQGVLGVLKAGVDGDLAGFVASEAAIEGRFMQEIEHAASESGIAWSIVDGAGFSARF